MQASSGTKQLQTFNPHMNNKANVAMAKTYILSNYQHEANRLITNKVCK